MVAGHKAVDEDQAALIRSINAALTTYDFDLAARPAKTISNSAQVLPNYCSESSDSTFTKTHVEIREEHGAFNTCAVDNEQATLTLINASETSDVSSAVSALKSHDDICKSGTTVL